MAVENKTFLAKDGLHAGDNNAASRTQVTRTGGLEESEEDRVADEEANDKTVEEEPEPAEEEPEPEPAEEEEVKPTKRGGRSASMRGARGGKTSGIPRAPLRDKNAQAETA